MISGHIPEFISFIIAFITLGFFFGLLGYVFYHTSPKTLINPPLNYRDYWSSIHSLGKSDKREYSELDRRFGLNSVKIRGFWNKIISGITLPQPDIAYVLNESKKQSNSYSKGDLYDLSNGRVLGSNLVNPNDLVSKFRPYILKMPEYSTNTRGVRRIVFEKLLENFLGKILSKKFFLGIFSVLSIIFVILIQINQTSSPIQNYTTGLPFIISICFCVVTLFFVWRWSIRSKKLFLKRPDERILILIVYIVLAFLFGFSLK